MSTARVRETLQNSEIELLVARDDNRVLELLRSRGHEVQAVCFDLAESKIDSKQLIPLIKVEFPALRVIGIFPHVREDLGESESEFGIECFTRGEFFSRTLKSMLA